MIREAVAIAVTSAQAVRVAEAELAALHEKQAQLSNDYSKAIAEIERLVAAEQREAGKRLLDGANSAPPNTKRKSRVAALREALGAAQGALELVAERVSEAETILQDAHAAHLPDVLALCCSLKLAAADQVRAAIEELAPTFTKMVAAQKVQDAVLGTRFAVPHGFDEAGLFNGSKVIERLFRGLPEQAVLGAGKLVGALPHRFVADGVTFESISTAATELASKLQSQINGKEIS